MAGITEPVLWGKQFSELYGQALDQLKADAPGYTALLPADPGIAVLDALLHQAQVLGEALDRLPAAALVSWLNYLGVVKKGPVAAKGIVALTLEPDRAEPLLIPAGTRFLTDVSRPSPGLAEVQMFVTEANIEVSVGQTTAEIPVVAERAGTAGNVGQHTILHAYRTPPYVRSIDNPQPMAGGTDSELDLDALERGRKLLRHHWRAVAPDDYEQLAISVSGIARARTLDLSGVVILYLLADNGAPANDALIRQVITALTPTRVQGVALQVLPAGIRSVDLTARIRLQVGYTQAAVQRLAEAHLSRVLSPMAWTWGRKVAVSELLAALEEVQGVDLVEELLLPHASIVLAPHELARLGTLTVAV